jgi:hypothetical protein
MEFSPEHFEELLSILKIRFEKNMNRHNGLEWAEVQAKLEACLISGSEKLWSLNEMERTGGEPDVVTFDKSTKEFIFYDCSAESPKGRRSICYDREGLESRKEFKPKDTAAVRASGSSQAMAGKTRGKQKSAAAKATPLASRGGASVWPGAGSNHMVLIRRR